MSQEQGQTSSETTGVPVVSSGATMIQALAQEASEWFETAYRGDDPEKPYTRTKDGAPAWIGELVRKAHDDGDMLPDDWRFETVSDALDWLAEGNDPDDLASEFADTRADVYTSDRIAWLASHSYRPWITDEASRERGLFSSHSDGEYGRGGGGETSILDLIAAGQFAEAEIVYYAVLAFLRARAEEVS